MSHSIRHDKTLNEKYKQSIRAMKQHEYYVYITTNPNRTVLYIGMTNDIARRLVEHFANRGKKETFAGRTYCYCLIYLELFQYVNNAIDRETELKAWRRAKKEALIAGFNPKWKFLNTEWCDEWPPRKIWGDYYESLRHPKDNSKDRSD